MLLGRVALPHLSSPYKGEEPNDPAVSCGRLRILSTNECAQEKRDARQKRRTTHAPLNLRACATFVRMARTAGSSPPRIAMLTPKSTPHMAIEYVRTKP